MENNGTNGMSMMATPSKSTLGTSNSLSNQISNWKNSLKPWCNNCNRSGHWTSKCQKLACNKCFNCRKFRHRAKDCWAKPKKGDTLDKKKNGKKKKKQKNADNSKEEQTNTTMEVAFPIEEIDEENMEMLNFDMYNACNLDVNDDHLIWYDWVADTTTTSHITHQREAFITYTPCNNGLVTGVGGQTAKIAGRGTVLLTLTFNGKNYIFRLEDVIHIPEQTNNLISLGRWDKRGGTYIGVMEK